MVTIPPEKQLQALGQVSYWGELPQDVFCPSCGKSNERYNEPCYICGKFMAAPEKPKPSLRERMEHLRVRDWIVIGVVVLVLAFIVTMIIWNSF